MKTDLQNLYEKCSFSMLMGKIDIRIINTLNDMGFYKPTSIQAETLPYLLQGKDLVGAAKTGTGKTLAFLIPVVDTLISLGFETKSETGCIILSPTRELSLQIHEVLTKLLAGKPLSHCLIVGGEKKAKDLKALQKGANIVVSTPGRLLQHLKTTKELKYTNLQCLVIDEADKLLEAGFELQLSGILKLLPTNRQTILFSATMDEKVKNLANLSMKMDPVIIAMKHIDNSTVQGLQQGYFICPIEKRIPWLCKMLKRGKRLKVIVFFSSCISVDFHYEFLKTKIKDVTCIHGRQSQAKRKETYLNFVNASNGVLLCTDVAARGLDIPSVDWIVQFEPPINPKEYIHRVGRTARGINGKGNAVILLRPEEEDFVKYLHGHKIYLDKYNFTEASNQVQEMLEQLIQNNGIMRVLARKAYLAYVRYYKSHPLKSIFDIETLDLKQAAKGFGLLNPPHIDFLSTVKKKR